MLKLYTDQQYLTPENRSIVFPLLFDLWYVPNKILLEKYQIVPRMEDCDIAVLPVDIAYFSINGIVKSCNDFIDRAIALQKIVWVYSAGDFGQTITKPVITFRLGGFDSKLNSNTLILPSFINDPYVYLKKEFKPISKENFPKIGFVGNASNNAGKKVKEFLSFLLNNFKRITKKIHSDYQSYYPSSIIRFKLLSLLDKSNAIVTDFIFRKKYRAGAKTIAEKESTTLEFFENLERNPYTFCLRGGGNFSVRLYETLAMGRIPVVVNTDIRLPLNKIIDWSSHCVFVTKKNLAENLVNFHTNISPEKFILMQENNRELWLGSLERVAYFCKIYSIFKQ